MQVMRTRPAAWFWAVAILFALWGAMGIFAFYSDVRMTPADAAKLSAYDAKLLASRPAWFLWVYGLSVWSGFAGSVALLARSRHARPLFVISLATVLVMFGFMFVATDIIAVKGFVAAAAFPIFIAVVAALQIGVAGTATRRGWTG